MARDLLITENLGIYRIRCSKSSLDRSSTNLESLIELVDPGIEPEMRFKFARMVENLLGPKREGDHGQIQQGLVGT